MLLLANMGVTVWSEANTNMMKRGILPLVKAELDILKTCAPIKQANYVA